MPVGTMTSKVWVLTTTDMGFVTRGPGFQITQCYASVVRSLFAHFAFGREEGGGGLVGGLPSRHCLRNYCQGGGGSGWVPQPGWVGQKFGTPPPSYNYGLGGWVCSLGSPL